jgi:hypothetical protein
MCDSFCEGCNLSRRTFLEAGAGFILAAAGCDKIGQIGKAPAKDKITEKRKEAREMDNLEFITYCGLYCGLCSNRGRIPRQANALRETMAQDGWDKWGAERPGFSEFWKFLTNLCDPDKTGPGCRQDCGAPFCSIRKCARDKKIDVCVFCEEYPCKRVLEIAKGYPTLISDGKRMKKIGIEAWVGEQKARAETGFVYSDIRCHPYNVPDK